MLFTIIRKVIPIGYRLGTPNFNSKFLRDFNSTFQGKCKLKYRTKPSFWDTTSLEPAAESTVPVENRCRRVKRYYNS